jgi:hypothetical protein
MSYVSCIRNETLWRDDPAATYDPVLIVGHVYKVAQPAENDGPYVCKMLLLPESVVRPESPP